MVMIKINQTLNSVYLQLVTRFLQLETRFSQLETRYCKKKNSSLKLGLSKSSRHMTFI